MLLFSALLYVKGESVSQGIRHFAARLASERGDAAVILAAQSIRAVAMGVVVTAVVQSVLGGIGLAVCGVSGAVLLTVLMFILCLAQIGPVLVMLPATAWLFWHGYSGMVILHGAAYCSCGVLLSEGSIISFARHLSGWEQICPCC
ncbi:putative inner membrane protein [compost metagenome]